MWFLTILCLWLLHFSEVCNAGVTSRYTRRLYASVDMPIELFPPPESNAPEQVHITQGDHEGRGMMMLHMIISWVTQMHPTPNVVTYWEAEGKRSYKHRAHATTTTYRYYNYSSGFITLIFSHDIFDTKYIYKLGKHDETRRFSFRTPPQVGPDVPYIFGVIGDLEQTYDSNQTLERYVSNPKGQAVLFIGDISYADNHPFHDNRRWDTWGRFAEKSTACQPWIWTAGNHEIDYAPEFEENTPFRPYKHRYHVPYRASQSTSPLWYSIKRASAHIIVLSSYSAFGTYTPQYNWLEQELPKVNRAKTPWLIVLVHSPFYNSYNYHYMEGEGMRVMFEPWFVKYKVDLVFSGHVHAYERSEQVSNVCYNITNGLSTPVKDASAPVYVTIGDGGNIEGLATSFTEPQPSYSAFREESFGHAILELKNRTHAFYKWHQNQDDEPTAADSTWFYNRYWYPHEEPSSTTSMV
ncbi:Purple acid phosphatase [Handroanthus impetiginosus]|uniref:Purple acid phosphatase n=1 Tax=Handroanthus impetiginosus TaxID=429701 RepID=A0A2G9G1M8_9LAMI|nr:Purple acid phosphatase [Handroanthus impetiginosus]